MRQGSMLAPLHESVIENNNNLERKFINTSYILPCLHSAQKQGLNSFFDYLTLLPTLVDPCPLHTFSGQAIGSIPTLRNLRSWFDHVFDNIFDRMILNTPSGGMHNIIIFFIVHLFERFFQMIIYTLN